MGIPDSEYKRLRREDVNWYCAAPDCVSYWKGQPSYSRQSAEDEAQSKGSEAGLFVEPGKKHFKRQRIVRTT